MFDDSNLRVAIHIFYRVMKIRKKVEGIEISKRLNMIGREVFRFTL